MNFEEHIEVAEQYFQSAYDDMEKNRHPVVADNCTKVVGQLLKADANRKKGSDLRSHRNEFNYAEANHPKVYDLYDKIFNIYNSLGYEGSNGEGAEMALQLMEEVIEYFEEDWGMELWREKDG